MTVARVSVVTGDIGKEDQWWHSQGDALQLEDVLVLWISLKWEKQVFSSERSCRVGHVSYWQGQLMLLWKWRWTQALEWRVRWNPLPCIWMTALCLLSPGEPISSEHFHRAVNVNDEDLLLRILEGGWESTASFSVFLPVPTRYTDNTRYSFVSFS